MIENVDYHITDVCNLNCASCMHFCPLVPKSTPHKSLVRITKDLLLLSKFKNYIKVLTILGGEPTLHPELNKILTLARTLFPDNEIHLITNGTTCNKFEQWKKSIENNNVTVYVSAYPYKQNYEKDIETIQNIVNTSYYIPCNEMFTSPFSLNHTSTKEQITSCEWRGICCQLKDEHLYLCPFSAYLEYLHNSFPVLKNHIVSDGNDIVDLNYTTIEEIENMVYKKVSSVCQHCTACVPEIWNKNKLPWKKSEKAINEWVY